jgi:Protein of unknown function (DUF2959)
MKRLVDGAFRVLVTSALLLTPGALRSAAFAEGQDTEGIKQTERFVKAGGQTAEAVAKAKLEIQNTLNAYNALVQDPSKDLKGAYKNLLKSQREMDKKVEEARKKLAQMNDEEKTYFAGRSAGIEKIQDQDLRNRAKQRLQDSQAEYTRVIASLQEAGGSLEPFRKELSDQIAYLGSDLNPSAIASLKSNVDKLNDRGGTLFAKTDEAIKKTNDYFGALRAQPTT